MSAPDSVWTRAPTPSSPKGGHEATAGSHAGKWPVSGWKALHTSEAGRYRACVLRRV